MSSWETFSVRGIRRRHRENSVNAGGRSAIVGSMQRTLLICLVCLGLRAPMVAQSTPPGDVNRGAVNEHQPVQDPKVQKSEPVIVVATGSKEDPIDVPFSVQSIDGETFERRSYRTVPQALRDVPGVMVQETAHGHGSPYIRGFTSFRTLFLIDGIRLNNSVFRPGPNQYWNTVDPFSLDRLEIVKGPASALYGSDAIGGTVYAHTKSVGSGDGSRFSYGGNTRLRYSTAEDSIQGRGELDFHLVHENGGETGVRIGGTSRAFGDLEGGRGVGTQPGTGYGETDIDFKVEHWLSEDARLVFLHQRVDQNDVPRTHRTVDGINWRGLANGSDLTREFDQNRELTYLQYHREGGGGVFDGVHASLSWHRQREERNRIRSNTNQEVQGFDVGTLGASLRLESSTPVGELTYGVELYHDDVDSFFRRSTSPVAADSIQGPVADDATYDLFDVYVQDVFSIAKDTDITLGARFSYIAADADSVRDPMTNQQTSLHENWKTVVGSARFRSKLSPGGPTLFGGVSQGYRAPNLSDLSRFDTARSNEFEVPALGLDPEEYISYEVGIKAEDETFAFEASWFYTDISDQILRFPTGAVNASGEAEVTKANVGDGHIEGVELGAAYQVRSAVTLFGNATYMYGRVTNFDGSSAAPMETYPTRLMPFTMQVGLRWEPPSRSYWAETVVVHAADADRLSFSDQRDTSRIPAGGTPGYTVWHLRGGWQVTPDTSLTVLLENVTDADYRVHGSGVNRPGRNFVLGFATDF